MEPTSQSNTKSVIGFFVFLGVAASVTAFAMSNKMSDKKDETPIVTRDESTASTSAVVAISTVAGYEYKNGTYSATGTYKSPAGIERVTISVALENDIVTEATFKGLAEHAISIKKQEEFANGYKALVVGKNIDSLALGKVSGSSLTGTGFNDALEKIKDEAKQL